jgi:hypothetical protein
MAPLFMPIEVAHTDRNHVMGTWRNVFVNVWRYETHGAAVVNLRPVIERLKAAHPAGIAVLTVLEPSAEMPTAEARKELPKLYKDVAKGIACSALVFEGEGFRAAAIRALTTTFNMLASQPPHSGHSIVDCGGHDRDAKTIHPADLFSGARRITVETVT